MRKKSLELYIHIPFCAQKCLYCDFLSAPAPNREQAEYMDQLRSEVLASGPWYEGYEVETVFIGGGTPSVLEPEQITLLLQVIGRAFAVSEDAEITIEANPGTLLGKKLPIYKEAGINRLSLGLQSANNDELKYLGRIHTFEDFLKCYQWARMEGFSNINIDLMSAIPGQTRESWRNTLRKIIMLKPEHISAYSLMIEDGTPFGSRYKGAGKPNERLAAWPELPDEEEERQMYYLAQELLEEAGYGQYEISNFARPECRCRHNVGYWTGVEYLGLGLGASSCVKGRRFSNEADMEKYQKLDFSLDGLELLHGQIHFQSRKERMEEFMFLGLRMLDGVTDMAFTREFGIHMESVYGQDIRDLLEKGLLKQKGTRISLTGRGIDVSNYVLSRFLLDGE